MPTERSEYMSLSQGISKFATKVTMQASASINKIAEEYFLKHVDYSPSKDSTPEAYYSKGVLINSWFPSIGKSPSSVVGTVANTNGTDSRERIKAMFAQNPFWGNDNTVTLANNVSWSYRADRIGWPRGLDPATGWSWSGNVGPYMMTSLSKAYIKGKYSI